MPDNRAHSNAVSGGGGGGGSGGGSLAGVSPSQPEKPVVTTPPGSVNGSERSPSPGSGATVPKGSVAASLGGDKASMDANKDQNGKGVVRIVSLLWLIH